MTFGFNKDAYKKRGANQNRHLRLALSVRPGHLERDLLSGAATRRGRGKFDELAYYAEHFDTVEINSTFYGVPRPRQRRAGRTARPGTSTSR